MPESNPHLDSTRTAWNRTALDCERSLQRDIEFLRRGGSNLLPAEQRILGDLHGVGRAIHLQCSHGLDSLSLVNMGVGEVIGIDISPAMLQQARRKSEQLQAPAHWIECDVLSVPESLNGTADLVYTGRGALCWVFNLSVWAQTVQRLLKPEGRLFVHEGHPLNWVWDHTAPTHSLRADGCGYFDSTPRANDSFPASAIARLTPEGEAPPAAWEWQWTLGQVVTAVASAGLRIEHVEEHPEHFWNHLAKIPAEEMKRLPHSFSLVATRN